MGWARGNLPVLWLMCPPQPWLDRDQAGPRRRGGGSERGASGKVKGGVRGLVEMAVLVTQS